MRRASSGSAPPLNFGVGVGQAAPAERTCKGISFSGIGGLGVTVLTKNLASKANCYYNYGYAHRF
jgi:hypothetical protein